MCFCIIIKQNVSVYFIDVFPLKIFAAKQSSGYQAANSFNTINERSIFMIITKFETWWVERGRCLFDEKRQGGAKMGWDVIAIKLTTDTGIEGVATCMAARSGAAARDGIRTGRPPAGAPAAP